MLYILGRDCSTILGSISHSNLTLNIHRYRNIAKNTLVAPTDPSVIKNIKLTCKIYLQNTELNSNDMSIFWDQINKKTVGKYEKGIFKGAYSKIKSTKTNCFF